MLMVHQRDLNLSLAVNSFISYQFSGLYFSPWTPGELPDTVNYLKQKTKQNKKNSQTKNSLHHNASR